MSARADIVLIFNKCRVHTIFDWVHKVFQKVMRACPHSLLKLTRSPFASEFRKRIQNFSIFLKRKIDFWSPFFVLKSQNSPKSFLDPRRSKANSQKFHFAIGLYGIWLIRLLGALMPSIALQVFCLTLTTNVASQAFWISRFWNRPKHMKPKIRAMHTWVGGLIATKGLLGQWRGPLKTRGTEQF